jgi:hypothetical protein
MLLIAISVVPDPRNDELIKRNAAAPKDDEMNHSSQLIYTGSQQCTGASVIASTLSLQRSEIPMSLAAKHREGERYRKHVTAASTEHIGAH